jgi:F-type H+-transporting ATPase subunit b
LETVFGTLGISWQLLLSQIVNFLLLVVLLRLLLYQPVLNILERRRERIAQGMRDVERASAAAAEAEQEKERILEEARREAQDIRAQASRNAEKIAQEIRERAEQDAIEIRQRAHMDAQAQMEDILADAQRQIADLAILATEQILGRELQDRQEQTRFVSEFLAQQNGGSAR